MKLLLAAAAATALMFTGAIAEEAAQPTTKGTEATGAMSDQVPDMKAKCPDAAQVDTKAAGTEATEQMSEAVPTMKPDADCPETTGSTTKPAGG